MNALVAPRDDLPAQPPSGSIRRFPVRFATPLRQAWAARDVSATLARRTIAARYKRNLLGAGWVVLTPLAYLVVFNVLFVRIAKVDTGGVPYSLFAYSALIPWGLFSSAVGSGATSILTNVALVNRLPVDRTVYPLSCVVAACVDAVVIAVLLPVLYVITGTGPSMHAWWLLPLLAVLLLFTSGVVMLLAAITPYVRDLRQIVPLFLQLALLVTPVGYRYATSSRGWRTVLAAVNPLAPVVDGFRSVLVGGHAPDLQQLGVATAASVLVFSTGLVVFDRLQWGFADVA